MTSPRARAKARAMRSPRDTHLVRSPTRTPRPKPSGLPMERELTGDLYRAWRADVERRADEIRRRSALARADLAEQQQRETQVAARIAAVDAEHAAGLEALTETVHRADAELRAHQGVLAARTHELRAVEQEEKARQEALAAEAADARERLRQREASLHEISSGAQADERESHVQQHRLEVEVRQLRALKEQLDASLVEGRTSLGNAQTTTEQRRAVIETPLLHVVEAAQRQREAEEHQLDRVTELLLRDRAQVTTLLQAITVTRDEISAMETTDAEGAAELEALRARFAGDVEGALEEYARDCRTADALEAARPAVDALKQARADLLSLQGQLKTHQKESAAAQELFEMKRQQAERGLPRLGEEMDSVTTYLALAATDTPSVAQAQAIAQQAAPQQAAVGKHHARLVAREEEALLAAWDAQMRRLTGDIGDIETAISSARDLGDDASAEDEARLEQLQRRLTHLQDERAATASVIHAWKRQHEKKLRLAAKRAPAPPLLAVRVQADDLRDLLQHMSPAAAETAQRLATAAAAERRRQADAERRAAELLAALRAAKDAEAAALADLDAQDVHIPLRIALSAPPAPVSAEDDDVQYEDPEERRRLVEEYGHRLGARLYDQSRREAAAQRCAQGEAARLRAWELLRLFDEHRDALGPLRQRLDTLLAKLRDQHRVTAERASEQRAQVGVVRVRRRHEARVREQWQMSVADNESRMAEHKSSLLGSMDDLVVEAREVQARTDEVQSEIAQLQQGDAERAGRVQARQAAVRADVERLQAAAERLAADEARLRAEATTKLAPLRRELQDVKDTIASVTRRASSARTQIDAAAKLRREALERVQAEMRQCRKLQWELQNSVTRNDRELEGLAAELAASPVPVASSSASASPVPFPALEAASDGEEEPEEEEEHPEEEEEEAEETDHDGDPDPTWTAPNRPITAWTPDDVTQLGWLIDFLRAGGPVFILQGARQSTRTARAVKVHASMTKNKRRIDFRPQGRSTVRHFVAVDKLARLEPEKRSGALHAQRARLLADCAAGDEEDNRVFSLYVDGGECEDLLAESASQRRLWVTALQALVRLRAHNSLKRLNYVMRSVRGKD